MDFSKLRHRLVFLRPTELVTNSMGETVPRYKAFKPYLPLPLQMKQDKVYLTHDDDGNAILIEADGKVYAHKLMLREFSVAGYVVPMSGREYEESQKLRTETTYKISTRYFPGITSEMRIFHNGREFEIVSVLDLEGRREELQIVAIETGRTTAQTYTEDSDG